MYKSIRSTREAKRLWQKIWKRSTRSQHLGSEERKSVRSWRSASNFEDLQTLKNIRSRGT